MGLCYDDDIFEKLRDAEDRLAEQHAMLYNANLQKDKLTSSYILRKQAEAVDAALEKATFYFPQDMGTSVDVDDIREYAQLLRQQADEIEK